MTFFQAIILAIIEGITEFLPVSSTGHMIIGSTVMGIEQDEFVKLFTVAVQFGTILSVVWLYRDRFFKSMDFYFRLLAGFIPAVIAGLLFKEQLDKMLENVLIVGVMLFVGGVIFLFIDKWTHSFEKKEEERIGYTKAMIIGVWQCLAMVPGVSRSAATIIGGMTQGLTRKAAAEFSFFLAVPTMFAATAKSIYDYLDSGYSITTEHLQLFAVGNIVAFVVAVVAIRTFIGFLQKHGFGIFGWYRIALGGAIILLYLLGVPLNMVG
ncbi:MAG TPA: undecaprenyl-diphosphatase UppP [Flavobacteriales bacterium]|nr:undecaprenyl-diphosphatase UppP [Flavobacteriales bacterium]